MAKKKKKNKLTIWVEYLALRSLGAFVAVLPECLAVWIGRILGTLMWLIKPARRRIARRNIEKAMPGELTRRKTRQLVEMFLHMALTVVETLWAAGRINKAYVEERFPVEGTDLVEKELAKGRGVIAFTPHLGNWELFGSCMGIRLGGITALARPTSNPLIERYVTKLRGRTGITELSTRDGVRPIVKTLKEGGALVILIDQHVRTSAVTVTFFGREAATTAVVASLALRFDAPVFAAYSLRDGHAFRHHGYIEGPIELVRTGNHEADVKTNTQLFNDILEKVVRRHPEQWPWVHKRWKLADRRERKRQQGATEEAPPEATHVEK